MKYSDVTPKYIDLIPWVDVNLKEHVHTEHCNHSHEQLNEENYKQLMSILDPNFLQQGRRAAQLRDIKFKTFEDDVMVFKVLSSTGKGYYRNLFKFEQLEEVVNDLELSPVESARLLIWASNLKIHCDCPSFLFYYEHLLTVLDSAIFPEDRPPYRNNPGHRGIMCKHLARTIKNFPWHSGDLAKYIKELRIQRGLI